MAKISTSWLREQIPTWLGTDALKKRIWGYYVDNAGEIDWLVQELGLKKGATADDVNQKIWEDWKSGAKWKRFEKRKLGNDWEQYFYAPGAFIDDFAGGYNKKLIQALTDEEKAACILRVYGQRNPILRDNFRMEIVTTPDDKTLLGWVVIVD